MIKVCSLRPNSAQYRKLTSQAGSTFNSLLVTHLMSALMQLEGFGHSVGSWGALWIQDEYFSLPCTLGCLLCLC